MSFSWDWEKLLRGGLPAVLDYPNSPAGVYVPGGGYGGGMYPVGYPVEQLPAEHTQTVPASQMPSTNTALMVGGGLLVLVAAIALVMRK